MNEVLLVGKGKLFESVRDCVCTSHDSSHIQILCYDEKWLKSISNLTEFEESIINKLEHCDFVYLFPDSFVDGINLVHLFSELKPLKLFVVTCYNKNSGLYKSMGADFVIFSKPDLGSYKWLLPNNQTILI
jgi:hypothetical protein